MGIEEHLSRYNEGGEYDSPGVFTIDREKAIEKLANHSLEHWLQVLYLIGSWLALDGKSPVDFNIEPGCLTISRTDTSFDREKLEHLEDYLLVDGAELGLAYLAMAQHVWLKGGRFVVECDGRRRSWSKGKSRCDDCPGATGVLLRLEHKAIKGDIAEAAEFFASTLAWTPYTWTFNELPMTTSVSSPKSVMMYNTPNLAATIIPGVTVHGEDKNLQLYCQWSTSGTTVVVVHGVAYPVPTPLVAGLKCAVFSDQVHRNLTKTEAVVSAAQRELWSSIIFELTRAFVGKKHLWSSEEFLTRNSHAFCRALWNSLDEADCLEAAQRLASVCEKEPFSPMILARAAIQKGDHLSALYILRPLSQKELSREEKLYLRDVDDEFAETLSEIHLTGEAFEQQVEELDVCAEVGPIVPKAVQKYCYRLAQIGEELGLIALAERLYFASYFLPRGLKTDWSTFLNVSSYMDMDQNKLPLWLKDLDYKEEHLDGIWAVLRLAQQRQSPQSRVLDILRERFRFGQRHLLESALNSKILEAWRLERRASQAEWFKWHFISPLENLSPRYPPLYHDRTYSVPKLYLTDSKESRLTLLKCRTVYLEYASLSYHKALEHGQDTQVVRYSKFMEVAHQVFNEYQDEDCPLEIAELGRIAIELRRIPEAAELLQRAICKYPAGDYRRLPLLVDLAILEPQRASSVIRGLIKVLNIDKVRQIMSDRQLRNCAWPFPFDLPSRLRRLAWELETDQALEVFRLARILYRKAFGTSWMVTTEQDWVADIIETIERWY